MSKSESGNPTSGLKGSIFIKLLFLGMIVIGLTIALSQIHSLVRERESRKQEVTQRFASGFGSEQTVQGPLMVLPITERVKIVDEEIVGNQKIQKVRFEQIERTLYVMPTELNVTGNAPIQVRNVDLYKIPLYTLKANFEGRFDYPNLDKDLEKTEGHVEFKYGTPYVVFAVTDQRGLTQLPMLTIAGKTIPTRRVLTGFSPTGTGAKVRPVYQSKNASTQATAVAAAADAAVSAAQAVDRTPVIRADLTDFSFTPNAPFNFKFDLAVGGTSTLYVQAPAEKANVTLQSDWLHPKFDGMLPKERQVAEGSADKTTTDSDVTGFKAQWQYVSLAQRIATAPQLNNTDSLSVSFIDPVDIYRLSDRATKYGVLFVCIVFAAFFFFEVLRQLPVHPVQYGLVGAAVSIFFLLLLALSEHIVFALAYGVSAAACIGLIVVYLASPLQSWLRAGVFGIKLTVLFGALYGLLLSTDNALMLGALLLFGLLAIAMIGTRKVNWYNLGSNKKEALAPA